ncbi:hypothetical protein Tsubulata_012666 [Turnera subulata]|uniref:DUF4283 domain-containing protein n=1 Tax=Turnera subulata TaxID=218843 RepID=A0A9Q0JH60_9ROSI|nr:hypothetical protein Tsubulata_012666 [Turnera subulata]
MKIETGRDFDDGKVNEQRGKRERKKGEEKRREEKKPTRYRGPPDVGPHVQPESPTATGPTRKKSRANGDKELLQADVEILDVAHDDLREVPDEMLPEIEPIKESLLADVSPPPVRSFRDAVTTTGDEWDLAEDVEYEEGDIVFVDSEIGKGIELSEIFKSRLNKQWSNLVVVKLPGWMIGYKAVCTRLQTLWKPQGKFQVIDLINNFYVVRFERAADCVHALCNGPWQIMETALAVQPWSSHFRAYEDRRSHAVVCVQFADLALSWYHPRILGALGSLVGHTIKINIKTHTAERGQYVRVAVEVDLTKPLKGKVLFEKQLYNVSYEGLPQVCLSCGCVGHPIIACHLAKSPTPASVDPRPAPVPALACI